MKKINLLMLLFLLILHFNLLSQSKINSGGTKVLIESSLGKMVILLYDETPLHKNNFLKLVREGYYDNQLFHRVIKGFMIQGGDPMSKNAAKGEMLGSGGPKYTIPAEFKAVFYHKKGALAAARTGDEVNPKKSSSASQFYLVQGKIFTIEELNSMVKQRIHTAFTPQQVKDYINYGGTPHLDGSYTVFGEVITGIEVIDKIANSAVDGNNRPITDIRYTMRILK